MDPRISARRRAIPCLSRLFAFALLALPSCGKATTAGPAKAPEAAKADPAEAPPSAKAAPAEKDADVIRTGMTLDEIDRRLLVAGATEITHNVGLLFESPDPSMDAKHAWYELADQTCLSITALHPKDKPETPFIVASLHLGERGTGYGGKFVWMKQEITSHTEIRLSEFQPAKKSGEGRPAEISRGKATNGLQAGILPSKPAFESGTTIELGVFVRNQSEMKCTLGTGGSFSGWEIAFRDVLTEDEPEIRHHVDRDYRHLDEPLNLSAGEEKMVRARTDLGFFYRKKGSFQGLPPGRYKVAASYAQKMAPADRLKNDPSLWWNGSLETGFAEIEILETPDLIYEGMALEEAKRRLSKSDATYVADTETPKASLKPGVRTDSFLYRMMDGCSLLLTAERPKDKPDAPFVVSSMIFGEGQGEAPDKWSWAISRAAIRTSKRWR